MPTFIVYDEKKTKKCVDVSLYEIFPIIVFKICVELVRVLLFTLNCFLRGVKKETILK